MSCPFLLTAKKPNDGVRTSERVTNRYRLKHTVLYQETKMEDFPIWLKITIYATIGLTVLYTAWGIVSSMLQS